MSLSSPEERLKELDAAGKEEETQEETTTYLSAPTTSSSSFFSSTFRSISNVLSSINQRNLSRMKEQTKKLDDQSRRHLQSFLLESQIDIHGKKSKSAAQAKVGAATGSLKDDNDFDNHTTAATETASSTNDDGDGFGTAQEEIDVAEQRLQELIEKETFIGKRLASYQGQFQKWILIQEQKKEQQQKQVDQEKVVVDQDSDDMERKKEEYAAKLQEIERLHSAMQRTIEIQKQKVKVLQEKQDQLTWSQQECQVVLETTYEVEQDLQHYQQQEQQQKVDNDTDTSTMMVEMTTISSNSTATETTTDVDQSAEQQQEA